MEGQIMIHGVAKELASLKQGIFGLQRFMIAVLCQKSNVPFSNDYNEKAF